MSNKIIQITEENLRKAVESGDLKQLAPKVFEKKKVKVQIKIDRWEQRAGGIVPVANLNTDHKLLPNCFADLINKPPMLMTLEWKER